MTAENHVDGGWAWVIVASSFFSRLLQEGIFKSLGVLLPTLAEYFDVPVWAIGNTISFMTVFGGVVGIISSSLERSLHPRTVVMVGGVLTGSGLILSACSDNWIAISLYLILMTGVGVRYAVLILMSVLKDYFDRHFSIANSLAISGTCFGVMIFAPLTQFFLDQYGWRGALLLLGAICFNLSACGALLRHTRGKEDYYTYVKEADDERQTIHAKPLCEKLQEKLKQCCGDIELVLFKDSVFLVWLSTNCLLEYAWAGWLIYLVPHAEDKGLSPYYATSLATTGGLGFLLGLFPTGYIVDKKIRYCRSEEIRALTLLLGGIALLIDPLFDSMVILTLLSILFGATIGSLKVTSYSSAKCINGDFTQILSWLFTFTALAKLASEFLTGWLYEYTRSYDISFAVLGSVMLFGSLLQTFYVVCVWVEK